MIEINTVDLSKASLLIEEIQGSSRTALLDEVRESSRTALEALFKQLKYSQTHGSPCKEGLILFQIGDILEKEKRLNEALGFYQLSYKIAEKYQDYDEQGAVLLRLGTVLFKLGLHEAGLDSMQRAHQLYEKFSRQISQLKSVNALEKSEEVNIKLVIECKCGKKHKIPLPHRKQEQKIFDCCKQEFVLNHRSSLNLHNINLSYQSPQSC